MTVANDDISEFGGNIDGLSDVFDEDEVEIIDGEIVSISGNGDTLIVAGPLASKPEFTVLPVERRAAKIDPQQIIINDEGQIIDIDGFDDDGAGYTSAPTVSIKSATGMGSGATIVVTIDDGEVDNWVVTNPGSGYSEEVNSTDDEGVFEAQSDENSEEGFKPGESITNFNYYYGGGTLLE